MNRPAQDASHLGWWQVGVLLAAVGCAVWGFASTAIKPAPAVPRPAALLRRYRQPPLPLQGVRGATAPINCARVACLALTFDDGPDAVVTPQILSILERHHVHATFFVIGVHVAGNEGLLRRMYQGGNEIGNHSWSHPDFTKLLPEQIQQQIAQTQAVIAGAGVPAPRLFRPPYGATNAVVKNNVPLAIAMWSVDPKDWDGQASQDIIGKIEGAAKPGGVVELHDIHQHTADSLDQLLNDLAPHYQLVTVSEMFSLAPGQRGEFFGR